MAPRRSTSSNNKTMDLLSRSRSQEQQATIDAESQLLGHAQDQRLRVFKLEDISLSVYCLPDECILVHATNSQGAWGKGFALHLRRIFPAAYLYYKDYCTRSSASDIVGKCLLIPPMEERKSPETKGIQRTPVVFIACLFTSEGYGKKRRGRKKARDSVERITENTESSLNDLRGKLEDLKREERVKVYSPQFNSGLFNVPWIMTRGVIESVFEASSCRWSILRRPDTDIDEDVRTNS